MDPTSPNIDASGNDDPTKDHNDQCDRSEKQVDNKSSKRGCVTCLGVSVGVMTATILILIFVVAPLMREEAEDLSAPKIDSGATDPNRRGALTDMLFVEQESEAEHPLDLPLKVAEAGLEKLRQEVKDYTAVMVKREFVDGKLSGRQFLRCKVRHSHESEDGEVSKAIYIKFVKPPRMAGQEAIWVEGENNGNLIGHGTGLLNVVSVKLEPESFLAMRGNRYPITELGIERLLERIIETGNRDRKREECLVEIDRQLTINDHPCTLITITHPEKRDYFDYYIAKIFIDDELNIPIGYEGYLWPESPGEKPQLIEQYFYQDIQLNVGLTDKDFDPRNPDYKYPKSGL